MYRSRNRQYGSTLIEVLISLLVISIGLLSTAALQMNSKRSNYDAAQRTLAAQLSQDLLERMRTNPEGLIEYLNASPIGSGSQGGAMPVNCQAGGIDCSPVELAAFDLWQWEQVLDGMLETREDQPTGGLISPRVCIAGPGFGATGAYTVAIAWRGLSPTSSPPVNDCGAGSGDYGDGDRFRRVLVVSTYVNAG